MTQQHLPPRSNIAPPTELFTSLDDTVHGTAEDVVLRSRRQRRHRIMAVVVALCIAVAAVTLVALLQDDRQPAAAGMTPDLAVSFVQDEFPGRFPDAAKLTTLFQSTCGVLDEGGSRISAITPMLDAGLSGREAAYIFEMSVKSTCPKYA